MRSDAWTKEQDDMLAQWVAEGKKDREIVPLMEAIRNRRVTTGSIMMRRHELGLKKTVRGPWAKIVEYVPAPERKCLACRQMFVPPKKKGHIDLNPRICPKCTERNKNYAA